MGQERSQILGKYGLGTLVGDTKEVGRVQKRLGKDQLGDERNWPPRIWLT
jgi:hypothetical protein